MCKAEREMGGGGGGGGLKCSFRLELKHQTQISIDCLWEVCQRSLGVGINKVNITLPAAEL